MPPKTLQLPKCGQHAPHVTHASVTELPCPNACKSSYVCDDNVPAPSLRTVWLDCRYTCNEFEGSIREKPVRPAAEASALCHTCTSTSPLDVTVVHATGKWQRMPWQACNASAERFTHCTRTACPTFAGKICPTPRLTPQTTTFFPEQEQLYLPGSVRA